MMALELINGKFLQDGQPVPLRFGDKDQIQLMNDRLKWIEQMKNGYVVEPDYETIVKGEIRFKCECGCYVYWEDEGDDESDIKFEGVQSTCHKCKSKYEVGSNDDGDYVVIKK